METTKQQWIYIRNNEVRKVFKNRKLAIKYLKEMLNQTLKDIDSQDKNNEYDYAITIPAMDFVPIDERESYLGL